MRQTQRESFRGFSGLRQDWARIGRVRHRLGRRGEQKRGGSTCSGGDPQDSARDLISTGGTTPRSRRPPRGRPNSAIRPCPTCIGEERSAQHGVVAQRRPPRPAEHERRQDRRRRQGAARCGTSTVRGVLSITKLPSGGPFEDGAMRARQDAVSPTRLKIGCSPRTREGVPAQPSGSCAIGDHIQIAGEAGDGLAVDPTVRRTSSSSRSACNVQCG